jgi:hypothetical protein
VSPYPFFSSVFSHLRLLPVPLQHLFLFALSDVDDDTLLHHLPRFGEKLPPVLSGFCRVQVPQLHFYSYSCLCLRTLVPTFISVASTRLTTTLQCLCQRAEADSR